MKKLPLGLSDFKTLIDDNYYYIDKSLFIKELYETAGQVILLPRPRRFGKTLNLSMLKYFFAKSDTDCSYLFRNTHIWKEKKCMEQQGQYPVIYLSFKDVKEKSWKVAYEKIKDVIATEFKKYASILGPTLSSYDSEKYISLLTEKAEESSYT